MEVYNLVVNKTKKIEAFHYTSIDGLKAIIDNNSLRFTDCEFLNDENEYIKINELLEEIQKKYTEPIIKETITYFKKSIDKKYYKIGYKSNFEKMSGYNFEEVKSRFYVFCMSKNNDSLPMWNYYSKSGNYIGYNLGISIDSLIQYISSINNINCYYGDVIYDMNDALTPFNKIIDDFNYKIKKLVDRTQFENIRDDFISELLEEIQKRRLFIKDSYFSHEEEFRIVLEIPENTTFDLLEEKFSCKNGLFIPHIDLKISKGTNVIKNVMASPLIDKNLFNQGLYRYLQAKSIKINKTNINSSKIKIRY